MKKQSWYRNKQSSINKEEEEEYVSYCADALFRLHILEQRLNRLGVWVKWEGLVVGVANIILFIITVTR